MGAAVNARERRLTWAACLVLVAIGAWLRVRGLSFGLPAVYNPDEIAIMSRALAFAKGDLNPHNFLYPTLYFYALFGWIGGFFAVARIAGLYQSAAEFQQSFFTDPTAIYLAGRGFSVACGVGVIVATRWLGERLAGRTTGLAAAAFMAVAPFAVRDAHYVKHDVPATLAIVLAVYAGASLMWGRASALQPPWGRASALQSPPRAEAASPAATSRAWSRHVALAGFVAGLATSVHYYLVFAALPLALATWWSGGPLAHRARGLALAAATMVAGFFAGSPFLLVEPGTAFRDIVANRQIVMDRAVDATGGLFPSAAAYARMLWADAMGRPVVLLAASGAVALGLSRPKTLVLLLAFPVAFLLFISNTVAATRYLNPVLPFVAVLAGAGVQWLTARVSRWGVAACALTLASAAPALVASVDVGTFFRKTDTRTLALDYVTAHVPAGSTVLVQPYSVPLRQSREGLVEALRFHLGSEARASTKFQIQLALPRWPAPSYRVLWLGSGGLDVDKIYVDPADLGATDALDRLRRLGVEYVALKGYNGVSPVAQPLEAALARDARLVAVFSPYRFSMVGEGRPAAEPFLHNQDSRIVQELERPGPDIYLWKL
jgi:uncharacterized membrane protein